MKTLLILGAGISRAANPRASMSKLPPLDADFFSIAKASNRKKADKVIECLEKLVGDYSGTLCGSLETAATYLYLKSLDTKPKSIYHIGFLDLLSLLNSVLGETTNSIKTGPRSILYRFLLSELKLVDNPEDLAIITFNYDLLIERTLQSISSNGRSDVFSFPGCYRMESLSKSVAISKSEEFKSEDYEHNGVAVLKLHGSANWQSTHTSAIPAPTALLNPKRTLHVVNSPEIPKSLTWNRGKRKVYLKPILVPPVSGKRGLMHEDISPLWGVAATTLRSADRIVIAGYSCPPLDLEARILLSENLRANVSKKIYVIDPSTVAAAKYSEICGVNHLTIYDSVNDWVDDAP